MSVRDAALRGYRALSQDGERVLSPRTGREVHGADPHCRDATLEGEHVDIDRDHLSVVDVLSELPPEADRACLVELGAEGLLEDLDGPLRGQRLADPCQEREVGRMKRLALFLSLLCVHGETAQ